MEYQHLKQVSRIKHIILEKYIPPWTKILGSNHNRLIYFDCYAGPGKYELKGELVNGSPIIAIESSIKFILSNPNKKIVLVLVEEDEKQLNLLKGELENHQPYPPGLLVFPIIGDASSAVEDVLEKTKNIAPSFFFIDPYGYPISIPTINEILSRNQTEALINFMYYQINRDSSNSIVKHHVDEMFGDKEWQEQGFLKKSGFDREKEFLEYFLSKINAKFKFCFRILFDPEDGMRSKRTKYYLIHASNHPRAVLLMKEVMWSLGDEEGVFEYSARNIPKLFSETPTENDLKELLLEKFSKRKITFDRLREETWEFPYIEKHYRNVIKEMKKNGLVKITPVSSRTERGLKERDLIEFLN